ncbi:hypothetical protein ACFXTI_036479 [Malus domestica]
MTNTRKLGSTRSNQLLEIIHTDVCGPFPNKTICGNSYFVTFIDDFSRYCYIFLIAEKSSVLDCFKIYKHEVEKQLEKNIKIVRSDRGGEYFGRFTETGQHKGAFAQYLEALGIVAQYTTPGTPHQNGVAERKNRTLKDMVRSMFSRSKLPIFLWGEALKTANYTLNRVPSKSVQVVPFEAWTGRKPSFNHFHVWGCRAEARFYNPQERKLDPRTVSCRFIGYAEKSKGFKFYCSDSHTRIQETNNAKFIEDLEEGIVQHNNTYFEEIRDDCDQASATMHAPLLVDQGSLYSLPVVLPNAQSQDTTFIPEPAQPPVDNYDTEQPVPEQQIPDPDVDQSLHQVQLPLRQSNRQRKPVILPDFVYLQETEYNIGDEDDPITFHQAVNSSKAELWQAAMAEELAAMEKNKVWMLVPLPCNAKPIGCKWVFKTKRNTVGKVERHKARLVAKGFTQREGIDYNETFSPVSSKDSLRVIMALTAHFNLELHQMDVKSAFLNGDLFEEIVMVQPPGFVEEGKESMVCRLNKSIYGLKQSSRQWYIKFDQVVAAFGFEENKIDDCIYLKVSGSKFIFLVLYVDNILLASSDSNLLHTTKGMLTESFDMKDLGEAHFVLGIEIERDRSKRMLRLSQKTYIDRILKRFNMEKCAGGELPIAKGDKLSTDQCPKNDLEKNEMKDKPYASLVGSIMYAQVCTRPDLGFAVSVLGRFQSNPGNTHWTAAKKVLRYLKKTRNLALVYRQVEQLEMVAYSDSDLAGCVDERKSTSGYVFLLADGAISWKSSKQKVIASSTMEAEFIGCYTATKQAIWLRNFIMGLKVVDSIERPITIFCDNKAAVLFSRNNKRSIACRLMDIKYLRVRDEVRKGLINIVHIGTNAMIADPMTKGLPVGVFKKHVHNMGMREDFDSVDEWE